MKKMEPHGQTRGIKLYLLQFVIWQDYPARLATSCRSSITAFVHNGFLRRRIKILSIFIAISILLLTACAKKNNKNEIRIGYFPNITHSQALVGLSRGTFQKSLGKKVNIQTQVFNAGPLEIEALFSGNLDIGYVGPSPAVNGFIRSEGKALKIIAGASSGGSALVVSKDSNIKKIKDLDGKKVASPELGNTQDVSLRHFLQVNGLKSQEKGGTVEVIPTENSNILTLFLKKEIEAAWVPEPWVSRLIDETEAKILIDERQLWPNGKFASAIVIVSSDFLKKNPELVEKFLKAHIETTEWINKNPEKAMNIANDEIKNLTHKKLKQNVIKDAYSRLSVTYDPVKSSVLNSSSWSFNLGYFDEKPKLKDLFDLTILNKILKEKGRKAIL